MTRAITRRAIEKKGDALSRLFFERLTAAGIAEKDAPPIGWAHTSIEMDSPVMAVLMWDSGVESEVQANTANECVDLAVLAVKAGLAGGRN